MLLFVVERHQSKISNRLLGESCIGNDEELKVPGSLLDAQARASSIHGVHTLQYTGLKRSPAIALVLATKGTPTVFHPHSMEAQSGAI